MNKDLLLFPESKIHNIQTKIKKGQKDHAPNTNKENLRNIFFTSEQKFQV